MILRIFCDLYIILKVKIYQWFNTPASNVQQKIKSFIPISRQRKRHTQNMQDKEKTWLIHPKWKRTALFRECFSLTKKRGMNNIPISWCCFTELLLCCFMYIAFNVNENSFSIKMVRAHRHTLYYTHNQLLLNIMVRTSTLRQIIHVIRKIQLHDCFGLKFKYKCYIY